MSNADRTALVTGANSGLGFEAAAQLAEMGYGSVTLATRTQDKADGAAAALRERTGVDVFDTLDRVGRAGCQPNPGQQAEIDEIVTHIADLKGFETGCTQN